MKIEAALKRMAEDGFFVSVDGDDLRIQSDKSLNDEQRTFLKKHKTEIIAELQTATVYDLDRYVSEKAGAIKYWRFLHNGVEVDFASGATVAEAVDLLRIGSDDVLEPVIEYDEPDAEPDTEQVTCGDCEHFQPDKIGDGSGIGSCQAGAWTPGRGLCLYPNAKRFCNDFKQE
jgi:hypothetical protein